MTQDRRSAGLKETPKSLSPLRPASIIIDRTNVSTNSDGGRRHRPSPRKPLAIDCVMTNLSSSHHPFVMNSAVPRDMPMIREIYITHHFISHTVN